MVLRTNLPNASMKRIGRIVNVYRNESRQRMKPKTVILRNAKQQYGTNKTTTYFLYGQRHAQKVANSFPFLLLVGIKICSEKLFAQIVP